MITPGCEGPQAGGLCTCRAPTECPIAPLELQLSVFVCVCLCVYVCVCLCVYVCAGNKEVSYFGQFKYSSTILVEEVSR